jgi:hypothetical protein
MPGADAAGLFAVGFADFAFGSVFDGAEGALATAESGASRPNALTPAWRRRARRVMEETLEAVMREE